MKKRVSCLILILCAFTVIGSLAWYHGFIPIASGTEKARMRHALNLKFLPSSVQVNTSASESWTDYIFEVDLNIDPDQFDQLLSGRDFEQYTEHSYGKSLTETHLIQNYSGFEVDVVWSWTYKPPNLRSSDLGSDCKIYTNKARDRVFIRLMSD